MKRHKHAGAGRGALAQESEHGRGAGPRDGAAAAAAAAAAAQYLRDDEESDDLHPIDSDLIDDYMSTPGVTTIHDILLRYDPRYDMDGIYEGIEHGGYRRALEDLLPRPPPRDMLGSRLPDNRARMLERLGRYREAEALYRGMADESMGHTASHLAMARVLDHLGRHKESAEALARACKLNPRSRQAFESGMRPDPRQADPTAVPLRLAIPMSVISAAGIVRSRAELGAASLLVQAECGLDLYPPSGARLPGCAGLGADMERFHHLIVEDVLPYYNNTYERPYYYDLTDLGTSMVERLCGRLDDGGDAAARIAASSRRVVRIGPHAVLEEACAMASPAAAEKLDRAALLERLQKTAERTRREIGNGIAFGEAHAIQIEPKARRVQDTLSRARSAPGEQWTVVAALAGDMLGLCARVAFDQRPQPRTSALGPPYPDIQDLYALLAGYCRERGMAVAGEILPKRSRLTARESREISRDMLRVISEP